MTQCTRGGSRALYLIQWDSRDICHQYRVISGLLIEIHVLVSEYVLPVAFIVDERFQGFGIGRYIYNMLIRLAKERGLTGFTAEVLHENTEMMKVFEKGDLPVEARLQNGIYSLTILFDEPAPEIKNPPEKYPPLIPW